MTDLCEGLPKPEDRAEHVRLVVDVLGVDEVEAEFIVFIERGESPGDVFIAGGKSDRRFQVRAEPASRTVTTVADE